MTLIYYACHPFFVQGYATMTNGENTAFMPIKEFLSTRGFPGYTGFQSDSVVFTHILHYVISKLGFGIDAYKHIIIPLQEQDIEEHLPTTHHQRTELRHRLPARSLPFYGPGPQEIKAGCCRRTARHVRVFF